MRLKTIISIGFLMGGVAHGEPTSDWSIKKMCEYHNGGFEERQTKSTGDVCKLVLPTSTASQEEAEEFCKTFFPYHITDAKPGKKTTCRAESMLICEPDWVQMYGRCYKMFRKLSTFKDAKTHCGNQLNSDKKSLKATIAFLHRDLLIGRWVEYFTRVNRFWLMASEVYTDHLYYNEGPNMLLAIDGHRYRVRSNSLLRVPVTEKAMTLCEYTPPMTQAESLYLMRRYDDIYYPSLSTNDGVYIRSASSLNRPDGDKLAHSKYCRGVLSPFLRSVGAQSAIPTKAFVAGLTKERSVTTIRTSSYSHDALSNSRLNINCTESSARNYGMDIVADDNSVIFRRATDVWRVGQPKETCDGGSWSSVVQLGRKDPGLESMSDARFAPIYCQTRFESQAYGDCPQHYAPYSRKNGQKWCHRFISKKVVFDEAVKLCAAEGSHISGYSDQDEMKKIDALASESTTAKFGTDSHIWLGAKRREQCLRTRNGFDKDPNSPCSRKRVFEWINAVADNPPDFLPNWMADEPTAYYGSRAENCVVLMKGQVNNWGGLRSGEHKLNDVSCGSEEQSYVICGQEAPVVLKKIDLL